MGIMETEIKTTVELVVQTHTFEEFAKANKLINDTIKLLKVDLPDMYISIESKEKKHY